MSARNELPLRRGATGRLLFMLVALLSYVAALGAAGLVVMHAGLEGARDTLATTLTLQIPADESDARLRTAMAVLHQTPGILSVRQLDMAQTARLLAPWLGPSAPIEELPVPRLIELRTDPERGVDLASLRRQLASVVPQARLEDHGGLATGLRRTATAAEAALAAVLALGLLLIGVLAVFAVRAGLSAERAQIELVHLLGAADRAIGGPYVRRWLWLGIIGGAIGTAAAYATGLALAHAEAIVRLQVPAGDAGWHLWAVLIGVAAAAALIAMTSAQITVRRRLARLP